MKVKELLAKHHALVSFTRVQLFDLLSDVGRHDRRDVASVDLVRGFSMVLDLNRKETCGTQKDSEFELLTLMSLSPWLMSCTASLMASSTLS